MFAMRLHPLSSLLATCFLPCTALAQLSINGGQSPASLVQNTLLGAGVTVSNITFNGQPANSPDAQAASFNSANANVGLSSGILLATGNATVAIGPNNNSGAYDGGVTGYGDADLAQLAGVPVFDAAVLEFDFVPSGGSISFDFVFASEEYIEYVGAGFNDVFGFFLSGPGVSGSFSNNSKNIALVPGTNTPVAIDNVNPMNNAAYYIDNGDGWTAPYSMDPQYIQYDGFTTALTATHPVQCGQTYHIKLAVADAGDEMLDSGVFLEGGAFNSPVPQLQLTPDVVAACMSQVNIALLGVNGGSAPYQVEWSLDGQSLGNMQDLFVDVAGDDWYVVSVTDACGGAAMDSTHVLLAQPQLDLPASMEVTCGAEGSLQMNAVQIGAGAAYTWTTNGNTIGTDQSISFGPPATPQWFVGTVTNACGAVVVDSTLVTGLVEPIAVEVTPEVVMPCDGTGAQIGVMSVNGGMGAIEFQWMFNGVVVGTDDGLGIDNSIGTYTVLVSDACGATATAAVNVVAQSYPPVVVTLTADTGVTCPGQTASASVIGVSGGTGQFTYAWHNGNGQTLGTWPTFQAVVEGTQEYTLTATDNCGHTGNGVMEFSIAQTAPLSVSLPNNVVCEGGSRTLIPTASGGAGSYQFSWPAFPGADSSLVVAPTEPTTYVVHVTDLCGTTATADALVTIEHPFVTIVAESTGYNEFAFSAIATPNAVEHAWVFGDGQDSDDAQPTHTYADMQPTVASVTILTAHGCPATDSIALVPAAQLFFPNAFTPNGDGINDVFGAVGLLIEEFELVIFDRWGAEVTSVSGAGATWDGRTKGGALAPTGVYVYSYRAAGERLEETKGLGHVTLLGDEEAAN